MSAFGRSLWLAVCALWLSSTWPVDVRAQAALAAHALGGEALRIDGQLDEWRGLRFARLGEDDRGALEYAFGYSAEALYVGARVRDDDFVRTKRPSPREDAIVLELVMPGAKGEARASEVWLFAGIPGEQAAVAAIGRKRGAPTPSSAIHVVEGPLPGGGSGYVLEARVPWSALAGGEEYLVARAAIRLHDVDGRAGARPRVLASARAPRPLELPPLLCEAGPNAAIGNFLRAKGLARANVRHDLFGDLLGGARLERVVVAGTWVALAGPEVEGGSGFHYEDLPVALPAAVRSAELRDLSGDGKAELLLVLRVSDGETTRELPYVLDWSSGRARRAPELEQRLAAVEPPARAAPAPAAEPSPPRAAREPAAPASAPLRAPGASELIAEFRKARGIAPALRPRFVQHVNLAEDARLESVLVFGADVLVLGKGYRGGTGYFYFTLPVRDGADVQRVFTGDVTGDGRRELFVRVKQRVEDVQREILHAYTFGEGGAQPIAAIEVRRAQGGRSVGNVVALVRQGKHWALRITPGVARGWDAQSYPFIAESLDGYGPLLLPWRDDAVQYRFDGRELVPGPLPGR